MIIFKKLFAAFLVLSSLVWVVGCNVTADEKANTPKSDYIERLSWVESADAKQDAKAAIAKQDYRLYVMSGRGQRTPGLSADQMLDLKQRCGTKYVPGSTDVVKDDEQLRLLEQLDSYAEEYNQIVAKHCP